MKIVRTLKHLRRRVYGLRAFVPGLRRRHRLEAMVGPLGFWDDLQAYQLRAVKQLGLLPGNRLLDLGCGPLQGGEAFIRYLEPDRYVGVDHRQEVIAVGREQIARFQLQDKRPQLLVSTTFGDRELGTRTFDFIWASQVLYYFDEPAMHRLFDMVGRRLNSTGIMAGDILGPAADRIFLRPPMPPAHTPQSLDTIARLHGLSVVARGTIRDFGYPGRLGLRTNLLLEITHRVEAGS
jgi:SAM-dependent methyltransferase